jgi:hypothetical protein
MSSGKVSSKAKRSGKGPGKGKTQAHGCASKTPEPDSRLICYRFNNEQARCESAKCRFAHVCGVCFAMGVPMYACSHQSKGVAK